MLKKKSLNSFLVGIIIVFSLFGTIFLFRENIYVVRGESMLPTLTHGDLVFVGQVSPEKIHADPLNGDIVIIDKGSNCYVEYGGTSLLYNAPQGQKIIHRVIDKRLINNTWFFLTKGDNNPYCDGGVREIYKSSEDYILFEYNNSNLVYIPQDFILGVVFCKIPYLGLILQEFAPLVLIPLIIIICIQSILSLMKRKIELRQSNYKLNLNQFKPLLILSILLMSQITISFLPYLDNLYIMKRNSMQPFLFYNDLIITEKKHASEIQIGDIIVIRGPDYFYSEGFDPIFWNYYPNGSYIIHHVLDRKIINDSLFFMTGIMGNEEYIDGMFLIINKSVNYLLIEYNRSNVIYIPQTEILGVMVIRISFIGYYLELIPYLFFYISIIICFIAYCLATKRSIKISKIN